MHRARVVTEEHDAAAGGADTYADAAADPTLYQFEFNSNYHPPSHRLASYLPPAPHGPMDPSGGAHAAMHARAPGDLDPRYLGAPPWGHRGASMAEHAFAGQGHPPGASMMGPGQPPLAWMQQLDFSRPLLPPRQGPFMGMGRSMHGHPSGQNAAPGAAGRARARASSRPKPSRRKVCAQCSRSKTKCVPPTEEELKNAPPSLIPVPDETSAATTDTAATETAAAAAGDSSEPPAAEGEAAASASKPESDKSAAAFVKRCARCVRLGLPCGEYAGLLTHIRRGGHPTTEPLPSEPIPHRGSSMGAPLGPGGAPEGLAHNGAGAFSGSMGSVMCNPHPESDMPTAGRKRPHKAMAMEPPTPHSDGPQMPFGAPWDQMPPRQPPRPQPRSGGAGAAAAAAPHQPYPWQQPHGQRQPGQGQGERGSSYSSSSWDGVTNRRPSGSDLLYSTGVGHSASRSWDPGFWDDRARLAQQAGQGEGQGSAIHGAFRLGAAVTGSSDSGSNGHGSPHSSWDCAPQTAGRPAVIPEGSAYQQPSPLTQRQGHQGYAGQQQQQQQQQAQQRHAPWDGEAVSMRQAPVVPPSSFNTQAVGSQSSFDAAQPAQPAHQGLAATNFRRNADSWAELESGRPAWAAPSSGNPPPAPAQPQAAQGPPRGGMPWLQQPKAPAPSWQLDRPQDRPGGGVGEPFQLPASRAATDCLTSAPPLESRTNNSGSGQQGSAEYLQGFEQGAAFAMAAAAAQNGLPGGLGGGGRPPSQTGGALNRTGSSAEYLSGLAGGLRLNRSSGLSGSNAGSAHGSADQLSSLQSQALRLTRNSGSLEESLRDEMMDALGSLYASFDGLDHSRGLRTTHHQPGNAHLHDAALRGSFDARGSDDVARGSFDAAAGLVTCLVQGTRGSIDAAAGLAGLVQEVPRGSFDGAAGRVQVPGRPGSWEALADVAR